MTAPEGVVVATPPTSTGLGRTPPGAGHRVAIAAPAEDDGPGARTVGVRAASGPAGVDAPRDLDRAGGPQLGSGP
jgi:hypothetical protein